MDLKIGRCPREMSLLVQGTRWFWYKHTIISITETNELDNVVTYQKQITKALPFHVFTPT
jgi:hypothetical protein